MCCVRVLASWPSPLGVVGLRPTLDGANESGCIKMLMLQEVLNNTDDLIVELLVWIQVREVRQVVMQKLIQTR